MIAQQRRAQWQAFWAWARFPVIVFAISRAAIFALSALSMRLVPSLYQFEERRQRFLQAYPTLDGLCRWDCGWFEQIARQGYVTTVDANIWPLYPLAARLLSAATGVPLHFVLVLLPQLFSLASFVLIFRIFRELSDEPAARHGLLLWAAFPFAFFQAAAYPEALMACFSAAGILLALRGRHGWAGAAVGVGLLARHLTALAGLALWAAQLRQHGRVGWLRHWSLLALTLPLVALGGYALFLFHRFGDPLAFVSARGAGWGAPAWWGVDRLWSGGVADTKLVSYGVISLVPGVGSLLLLRRPEHRLLAAFALPLMLLAWAIGLSGLGRYAASCWPAFLPVGAWLARHPGWSPALLMASALLQGFFAFLFMHQFGIV